MTLDDPRRLVVAVRDREHVSPDELRAFVEGYMRGDVSDALAAAFLMAVFLRGLAPEATLALTRAMVESGSTLDLTGVSRPKVDKHSTGGVADGVTLVFAPLAASLGLAVAKLSGRGLGHTGGTLDKLESIPGLRTDLSPSELERQVERVGCAVAAQSADLVPADGALYALRDATATVESVPLIAASVMSKKLAIGSDLILLDVKAGSGAFIEKVEDAIQLGRACLRLAEAWGRTALARVTDMSQPLGDAIGNALDIAEAVELLRGEKRGRLRELAVVFVADALVRLEGATRESASARAEWALDSGGALDRFREMVRSQGGDPRVADDPWAVLPRAPVARPLVAEASGILASVDAAAIGRASGALGAGRVRPADAIDPAVGIVVWAKIGDALEAGKPIGEIHARTDDDATLAASRIAGALTLVDGPVEPPPLVHATLE